ncbi:cation transporter [Schumannella luteola]|uniref:Cobalt-zinc-cadmium efflux system protein n=1 Tax=Schumannella luteola TaxID=472059 RepID=A0A852YC93_9MICO|nr:cation diffusion facilitator family transporter [Schumannella luteola]NYG98801.1 cobalt-zinc-cadmium efflux system protein [Schumannella luteola]TPX01935.1 cation transporter [Schumannella luteola]
MGAGHSHGLAIGDAGADSAGSAGSRHLRALVIAVILTGAFMVVEFIVGFATNSLALISDAGHMGTDVLGLAMALTAILLARRPATAQRTYGLYRLEVLAALANGVLLFGVAGYVIVEAVMRLGDPQHVPGPPLLITAVVGLAVNIVSFLLLRSGARDSINLRGAMLEVMGDMLGSVGVIVAAIILWTTGWAWADPIIGVGIGLFILPRTFLLTRQALRILLEVAPKHVDVPKLVARIEALPGVDSVHDLHVWTLTSGIENCTGHVRVAEGADYATVLESTQAVLDENGIHHATIQCEPASFRGERELPV